MLYSSFYRQRFYICYINFSSWRFTYFHIRLILDLIQAKVSIPVKKGTKISVTRFGIFRVAFVVTTCRARCFGGFRSTNTRFRFVVLIVNDRPHSRRGRSGPRARINGVD